MDDTGLVPVGVVATRPLVAEMLPDAAFPPADLPQPEATSANTATTAAAASPPPPPPQPEGHEREYRNDGCRRPHASSAGHFSSCSCAAPATAGWSLLVRELAPDPGRGDRRTADLVVADAAEIGVDDREVRVHALPDRPGCRLQAVGPGAARRGSGPDRREG